MRKRVVNVLLFIVLISVGVYHVRKPLPDGVGAAGDVYYVPSSSVSFFVDKTYVDEQGERHSDQQIFDEVIRMINGADQYILVDMFLFNSFQGKSPEMTRQLADELTDALIEKKQENSDVVITVISDPINTVYGGAVSSQFERLRESGIPVVLTDISVLRDSNPIYSSLWRVFFQWFGNSVNGGIAPHPFSAADGDVSIRSWLALVNFKANHRKLIVADNGGGLSVLVTSANPHDGSSAHSNVAVKVDDMLWRDVVVSEQAVGVFSGVDVPGFSGDAEDREGRVGVQLLTESAIRDKVIEFIDKAGEGDSIDVVMFYLSDRLVVNAFARASERGVLIRLVLDPNKDAFGYVKNGVPNRPVAHELVTGSDIKVRWCDTYGEQCHSKIVLFSIGDTYTMILGSANLTKRNLGDYNLETNVLVTADEKIPAISDAYSYMDEIWSNSGGRLFTTDYELYADDAFYKKVMYRIQEKTGLTSF